MIELMILFGLGAVALVAIALFAAVGFLLKLVFKVVMLPVTLGFGLVKVLLVGLVGLAALVFAPVLFVVVLALALPLLILGCLVGCTVWALSAAF